MGPTMPLTTLETGVSIHYRSQSKSFISEFLSPGFGKRSISKYLLSGQLKLNRSVASLRFAELWKHRFNQSSSFSFFQ